jgi:putative two-component system response regulator
MTSLKQISAQLASNYELLLAKSGALALQICMQERPDMILLDIEMPEMDGFETLSRIKMNPYLAHIPVIFLTAKSSESDEYDGLALGAIDYISKPFSAKLLLKRIENHLLIQRQKSELQNFNENLIKMVNIAY